MAVLHPLTLSSPVGPHLVFPRSVSLPAEADGSPPPCCNAFLLCWDPAAEIIEDMGVEDEVAHSLHGYLLHFLRDKQKGWVIVPINVTSISLVQRMGWALMKRLRPNWQKRIGGSLIPCAQGIFPYKDIIGNGRPKLQTANLLFQCDASTSLDEHSYHTETLQLSLVPVSSVLWNLGESLKSVCLSWHSHSINTQAITLKSCFKGWYIPF